MDHFLVNRSSGFCILCSIWDLRFRSHCSSVVCSCSILCCLRRKILPSVDHNSRNPSNFDCVPMYGPYKVQSILTCKSLVIVKFKPERKNFLSKNVLLLLKTYFVLQVLGVPLHTYSRLLLYIWGIYVN